MFLTFVVVSNLCSASVQDKHVGAFFALKYFFAVTTDSDAYDAGMDNFVETFSKYATEKTERQMIYYLCSQQLEWFQSLIPAPTFENADHPPDQADDDSDIEVVAEFVTFVCSISVCYCWF